MRSRRPGSKGTEWLLIKKKDEAMKPGFNIDKLDYSVLTKRSLSEIAGDEGSAEWESNRKAAVRKSAKWLQVPSDREVGKSGNREAADQDPETKLTKSSRTTKKRASSSATKKKASVKKKSRKAA